MLFIKNCFIEEKKLKKRSLWQLFFPGEHCHIKVWQRFTEWSLEWMICEWLPGFSPKHSLCPWYLHSALQGPGPWHRSVWWRGTCWGAAGTSDRSQSPWLSLFSPHPGNQWDSNQSPWTTPCNPACIHSANQETKAKFTTYKQLIENNCSTGHPPVLSETQPWWKNKNHKKKTAHKK